MKIHQNINHSLQIKRPVVTTGTFDGVHLGHQQILNRINEVAQEVDGESVLFSFFPHPRMVLYPEDHGLKLLHTKAEKHAALEAAGIDHLIEIPFTKQFAKKGAREYIEDILVNAIGVHTMVIGYDHRFGRSREGDINTMKLLAGEHGFRVEEIPARMIRELKVSSTKVRTALSEGRVKDAAAALGRNYAVSGIVVAGDQLGRTLGFPTANVMVEDGFKLIPADGVYAVRVKLDQAWHTGMMNIGRRPTVDANAEISVIEVHIMDLERDLYGMELRVEFIDRVRKEQRFASLDDLKEQLVEDRQTVLRIMQ